LERHVTTALSAAVITALAMFIPAKAWVLPTSLQWLGVLAGTAAIPAGYVLIFAGRTGGPEGLPPLSEVYLLTFVLWWGGLELACTLWRTVRPAASLRQLDDS
jgi:hypothetical protein